MSDERVVALVNAFDESLEAGLRQLAADPESIYLRSSLGETPLHLACFETSIEAIHELIAAGAEVNTLSECGSTPLSDAACAGRADVVRVLLAAGASLWMEGQSDLTMRQAVWGGSLEIVELLLDAGLDVNEQTEFAETALHLAAENDRAEVAALLIERGADTSMESQFYGTALQTAVAVSSEHCIALLSPKH